MDGVDLSRGHTDGACAQESAEVDPLCRVEWYPRWRDAVFSVGCLHDLEVFLENLNRTGGA